MTGYVAYVEYTTTKTETKDGKLINAGGFKNTPFGLGDVDHNYTASSAIVEAVEEGKVTFAFEPVAETVRFMATGGDHYEFLKANTDGEFIAPAAGKVAYQYDNVTVPMEEKAIPGIKAEMKSIPLLAKARRIAVYYSQIAAFQAKTDYGFDLGDQLAEKAVGQLSYEIDTEIVKLLDETAGATATAIPDTTQKLEWSRNYDGHISKAEHYEGFSEVIEIGRQIIYDRTKRFAPNYMIIASDVLPILTFMKGFQAAPAGQINGPYFAGTLNGLKVYVSPAIEKGRFLLGVNGDDMMSSVAVYAP